jgi:hypothetical protein
MNKNTENLAADDINPSLLSIIIDSNLAHCLTISNTNNIINDVVKSILLFIHSYMLLQRENRICVIMSNVASNNGYEVLFPHESAEGNFIPASVDILLDVVKNGLCRCFNICEKNRVDNSNSSQVVTFSRPLSMILCGMFLFICFFLTAFNIYYIYACINKI